MPKKTLQQNQQTDRANKRKADRKKGFDRLLARLDRIENSLTEQGVLDIELLPDPDVVLRVARTEYDTLSGDSVRATQQIMRNIVGILTEKANPALDPTLILEQTQMAFDATEALAVRAGFFVGLSRGMSSAFTLSGLSRRSAAKGGAR